MASKMSPEQLREQAQKLIKQADAEEIRRQQLIGKMVVDFIKKEFKDFEVKLFELQAKEIWKHGRIKSRSIPPLKQKQIEKSLTKQFGDKVA